MEEERGERDREEEKERNRNIIYDRKENQCGIFGSMLQNYFDNHRCFSFTYKIDLIKSTNDKRANYTKL